MQNKLFQQSKSLCTGVGLLRPFGPRNDVRRQLLLFVLLAFSPLAHADYGIVPPFQTLYVTGGLDYLATGQNFDSNNASQDIIYSGQRTSIGQFTMWGEGEYGIAKDYALRTRFSFVTATSKDTNGNVLASGSGFGDTILGLKWRTFGGYPGMTLELMSRIPFYSSDATSASELVVGNGSVDVGFIPHLITRHQNILFFLSPGLLFRTNGYASQFLLDAAVEFKFARAFTRLFYSGAWSMGQNLRRDSSLSNHNSVGAAGSYLRLSGSPAQMVIGAKLGIRFDKNYFAQVVGSTTIAGVRAPAYFQIGLNVGGRFDFFDPPVPRKTIEVPLDGDTSEAL